jgi:hypothetical protein
MLTSTEINRHIGSDLDGNGCLVYFVEFTNDDGQPDRWDFTDHADAYAFVRDEILGDAR